jgi:hypothetical protein
VNSQLSRDLTYCEPTPLAVSSNYDQLNHDDDLYEQPTGNDAGTNASYSVANQGLEGAAAAPPLPPPPSAAPTYAFGNGPAIRGTSSLLGGAVLHMKSKPRASEYELLNVGDDSQLYAMGDFEDDTSPITRRASSKRSPRYVKPPSASSIHDLGNNLYEMGDDGEDYVDVDVGQQTNAPVAGGAASDLYAMGDGDAPPPPKQKRVSTC